MHINTHVVSSNPVHGEMYLLPHYVIMFVSDFAAARWFSAGNPDSSTNKTHHNDITEYC